MLPILCSGITKTNIGLKVLSYVPLTLTDFPPQALFASRLTLRVKLLFLQISIPSSVAMLF